MLDFAWLGLDNKPNKGAWIQHEHRARTAQKQLKKDQCRELEKHLVPFGPGDLSYI